MCFVFVFCSEDDIGAHVLFFVLFKVAICSHVVFFVLFYLVGFDYSKPEVLCLMFCLVFLLLDCRLIFQSDDLRGASFVLFNVLFSGLAFSHLSKETLRCFIPAWIVLFSVLFSGVAFEIHAADMQNSLFC
jgi:hypothetical protein